MKGAVLLQLNDDDSILVQAQVPIDADRAKLFHFAFDWSDTANALVKAEEMLVKIQSSYIDPSTPKPKIETLS